MTITIAPGGPGSRPTWTSSAKDMVTTALGTSRVWVTLGYGILNEVYWPATGLPQIRDLGFIVAGPSEWFEVKRVNRYHVSMPDDWVPLPQVAHEGDGYRLLIEVLPDPSRDVVLILYRLTGDNMNLYALLAPHLSNGGEHNNARAAEDLMAWKDETALCLLSDSGFSRSSAGYVGASDGWQDFFRNGRMTWEYGEAIDGNVALLGELPATQGTLAIGFSDSIVGARTKARSSLSEGCHSIRQRFIAGWRQWGKTLDIPDSPADIRREAYLSAVVLKVHQDRAYPGSIVASLSVPWGNSTDSIGGYHLVWPRDCVEAGLALLGVGQIDDARSMLSYLIAIQNQDGSWNQNCFPDGRPFWVGIQLDEVGFPIILAAKLAEQDALRGLGGVGAMIRRAVCYLVHNGPISPQDRWEENSGISPFTLAIEQVETPLGIAYHRYNEDGYGEHADGSPYDGNGIGRAWPLLTGERGHFELQLGRDPLPYLEMMARMTGPTGLMPEQVWDGPPLWERGLEPGKPTGGVMPLVWAHAEFLKLLRARREKRPIELLNSLEEHLRRKTATGGTWHWRTDTPFDALPANRDLLVEMESPFVLHMGFDGWKAVEDRSSAALPFGRHGVHLGKDELAGNRVLDFTRYFSRDSKWEGNDYHIWIAPLQERLDVRGRPPAQH